MKSVVERVKCALYESPRAWFVGALPDTDQECRVIKRNLRLIKFIEKSRSKELCSADWLGGKLTGSEVVRRQACRQKAVRLCGSHSLSNQFVFNKDTYDKLESVMLGNIMDVVDMSGEFRNEWPKKVKEDMDEVAKTRVNYLRENMRIMELGWNVWKCVLMLIFISLFAYSAWFNSDLIRYVSYGWVAMATLFLGFYKSCTADVWSTLLKIAREDFKHGAEIVNVDLCRKREAESIKAILGGAGEKRVATAL